MKVNFVVVIKDDKEEKYCAFPESVDDSNNMKSFFDKYDAYGYHSVIIHYCKSNRFANELSQKWNEQYKRNGTYLSIY